MCVCGGGPITWIGVLEMGIVVGLPLLGMLSLLHSVARFIGNFFSSKKRKRMEEDIFTQSVLTGD